MRYEIFLCGDEALALDLTQEALIKILRAWQRTGVLTKSYAYQALDSVFADHCRKKGRSVQIDHTVEMPDLPQATDSEIDTDVTEKKCDDVRSAVRELPAPLKLVVFLRYYVGLHNSMISQELGITAQQVSRDIYRAHTKLRTKLKQWEPNQEGGDRGR